MTIAMFVITPFVSVFMPLCVSFFVPSSMVLSVTRIIFWNIHFIVPSVFYEIDGAPAGIIFSTMFAPLLLMPWWNVDVDRLITHAGRSGMDDDGLCINKFRLRIVTDVNTAIKTGLTDTDGHSDIGGRCC